MAAVGRSLLERFEQKVARSPGCWLWTASKLPQGYGQITVNYRPLRAHRVSWELFVGPIPNGIYVLHKCDNPSCVNPEHLFLGTHQDNMDDCKAKGRTNGGCSTGPRGEDNGGSKLTEKDILQIRRDQRSQRAIAADYRVSQSTIWLIKAGKRWRHVK